jgi:sec-independent protein translocase protein TatA
LRPVALPFGTPRFTVCSTKALDGRSAEDTMPNIGFSELLVILLILTLVFGASRLPALGEGVGRAIRSFKRGIAQDDNIEVSEGQAGDSSEAKRVDAKRVTEGQGRVPDAVRDAEIVDDDKS